MPFFFFDSAFFVLVLPAMALALWAQSRVKSTFNKYSKVIAGSGLSGMDIARRLLDNNGLNDIKIEEIDGRLTDHYDPRTRTLRLSRSTARSRSVAALGVAAHEVGHAFQHQQAYSAFQIRQAIVPVAGLVSHLAFPLFFVGFLFAGSMGILMDIGILFFAGVVVFHAVTLPVEFNASSQALAMLRNRGYLRQTETDQARKVLNAAALTYLAATAVAVAQLLRLLVLRGARD